MKIRAGFVSNSSSSSFVIRLYEMPEDMKERMLEWIDVMSATYSSASRERLEYEAGVEGFSNEFEADYKKGIFEMYTGWCEHRDIDKLESVLKAADVDLTHFTYRCEEMVDLPEEDCVQWMLDNAPTTLLTAWLFSKTIPAPVKLVVENIIKKRVQKEEEGA